jgi:hypothetical protein
VHAHKDCKLPRYYANVFLIGLIPDGVRVTDYRILEITWSVVFMKSFMESKDFVRTPLGLMEGSALPTSLHPV